MAQSRRLVAGRIGEGGQRKGKEVMKLHDLMTAAGLPYRPADRQCWAPDTLSTLKAFRRARVAAGLGPLLDKLGTEIDKECIDPGDSTLLHLADAAKILIPMPGACGWGGVTKLNDWFRTNKVLYNTGAEAGGGDRATYRLSDFDGWAVQTIGNAWRAGPVRMDCTTYVNLAVAVYVSGEAAATYDANCSAVGGHSVFKLARDRYRFREIVRQTIDVRRGRSVVAELTTAADVAEIVRDTDEGAVYVIERAQLDGFVKHMALLRRSQIYEFNTYMAENGAQIFQRQLETFIRSPRGGRNPSFKYFVFAER